MPELELQSNLPAMQTAFSHAEGIVLTDESRVQALTEIRDIVKNLVITDDSVAEDSVSLAKFIKTTATKIESQRKDETSPLYEEMKTINAKYKRSSVLTDEIERTIKNGINTYRKIQQEKLRIEEEKRKAAEQERLLALAESQKDEAMGDAILEIGSQNAAPKPVQAAAVIGSSGGSAGSRTVRKYRVVNFALLPDAYKLADEKKLGAIARDPNGERNIPGVEFYEEQDTVIR